MSGWYPPAPPSNAPYHPYQNPPQPQHAPPYGYDYYTQPPPPPPPPAGTVGGVGAGEPWPGSAPTHAPAHPTMREPYDAIDMDDEAAPDVLFIKNRGRSSTLEFPAYAIGDGILTVGTVREAAAHALDVAPARRVKLLYKGRLLKEDGVPAKSVGLKQNSQLMCVVSADFGAEGSESERDERLLRTADEPRRRHSRRGRSVYDDDEDDNNRPRRDPEYLAEPPRHGGRHRSSSSPPRGHPRLSSSGPGPGRPRAPSTNLSPSMAAGRRASSRPPSSSSAARSPSRPPSRPKSSPLATLPAANFNAASTSHGKIEVLEHYFATVIEPACLEYMDNPPRDPKTRDFEHRRISETVMTQLLLKADEINIDGDETARQRRKALIDRVHGLLQEVDDSAKG